MEYAGGGELFNRVAAPPRHHLVEAEARTFFRELLAGVEYCHNVVWVSSLALINDPPHNRRTLYIGILLQVSDMNGVLTCSRTAGLISIVIHQAGR